MFRGFLVGSILGAAAFLTAEDAAAAAAAAAAAPFDLPQAAFEAESVEQRREDGRLEQLVRFPSAVQTPFPANNTVWAHLSLPEGPGPFPCVVVFPVMAAPNIWIERQFIKRFEAEGLAVLWLEMPHQFHRRAHPSVPSGQGFLARTAPRLAFNFRQSVLDARRALSWVASHPKIDAGRIGVFGISLGAMVGSAAYSVDSTPRYAILLLGGADFPSLARDSSMTGPFLKQAGIAADALRRAWRGIDPIDYRSGNRDKPALLINARSDTVVPMANALRLKDAFPAARQVWLPLGHYSAILHLIWLPRWVSAEFRRRLGD